MRRSSIADIYPLAPMQQGMLFHTLYAPESESYTQQLAGQFNGELNLEALRGALQAVMERHPVLRSSFDWEELDQPVQIVHREVELPFEVEDWRGLSPAEREERWQSWLPADRQRGFVLSSAPLMRMTLIQMADREHRFVWSHHHILLDGWCLPLVLREVFYLYQRSVTGQGGPLPPVRPYRDFIAWLAQHRNPQEAEAFWRRELAGFEAPTPLEIEPSNDSDAPREAFVQTSTFLGATVTGELEALARRQKVTTTTLLEAAWGLVLGRYAGHRDVIFGLTVAGRPPGLQGVEEMVGLFINTVPVRVQLRSATALGGWLREIQRQRLEQQPFETTPLVDIQRWSDIPGGQPLFSSLLVVENYPVAQALEQLGEAAPGSLDVEILDLVERTNYPLALEVGRGERLELELVFDRRRFDQAAVRRMLGHLQTVLESFPGSLERSPEEISLLSPAERRQVLEEWSRGGSALSELPEGRDESQEDPLQERDSREEAETWLQLFRQRCTERPDEPAATFRQQGCTYGELDRRSDAVAADLVRRGAGPEQVVALLAERDLDFLVTLIGVLKAGAVYLPLDPAHPAARIARVLQRARPLLVCYRRAFRPLVDEALEETERLIGAGEGTAPQALELETLLEAKPAPAPAAPVLTGNQLAYVIFTSGSTGLPKGAMVHHRGMLNHLRVKVEELDLDARDVVAQTASQCFDISVWQFLAPLMVGGRVAIFDDERAHDPAQLVEGLRRDEVSILETVPSLLYWLVQEVDPEQGVTSLAPAPSLGRLRWLMPTGEALPPELCRRWLELYPQVPLINAYGPTECSDDVSHMKITAAPPRRQQRMPIGRAASGLRLYLLRDQEPVPRGLLGEIFVGGVGVGRGYLQDPARTAEVFVPDPFAGEAGARLYDTGDLGRWLDDAVLDFAGRRDHQIKIRGFRVELGEIEAVLDRQPELERSVVIHKEESGQHSMLVAYLVPQRGQEVSVPDLRHRLADALPDYMVPAAFVVLEKLPVTANGKLDRRALPEPEEDRSQLDQPYVAPRNEVEEKLAEVWSQVLGVEKVGVLDDFFELGGDSIVSIQIVARARQKGLHLAPRQLFEKPTIAGLAPLAQDGPAVMAEQGVITGEAPLVPIQRWFFRQDFAHPEQWNQSLLLEVRRPLDDALLRKALGLLWVHHDALRLRFRRGEDGWIQHHAGVGAPVPYRRLRIEAEDEAGRARRIEEICAEAQASLALVQGPVESFVYFDCGLSEGAASSDRLLLVLHHLVVDGVSWRILLEDLQGLYRQLEQEQDPVLPPKTTSFKRWAEVLAEEAEALTSTEEASYWQRFQELPAPVLPVDDPGATNTEGAARDSVRTLTRGETDSLLTRAPSAYRTEINDLLLTALVRAWKAWTGEDRLMVDLEGHGREDLFSGVDVSRTVGWFTALYPVLLELPSEDDSKTNGEGLAIKEIKEQLRAVPRRGMGFGLTYFSGAASATGDPPGAPPSSPAPAPAPAPAPILFNYLGQLDQVLDANSPFQPATESPGPMQAPDERRSHELELNAGVSDGVLHITWTYGGERWRQESMERWAELYLRELRAVIEHCLSPEAGGYTPSDFAKVDLQQDELDDLMAQVEEEMVKEA